jgi:hypothetical protein
MKARGPGMFAAELQVLVARSKTQVASLNALVLGSKPPKT